MTALGYRDDNRMSFAIRLLKKKRRRDGRWNLDAVHPDVGGGLSEWFQKHPKDKLTAFALEHPGKPSKMITLSAMRVMTRLEA